MTNSISRRVLLAQSGALGVASLIPAIPAWAQAPAAAPAGLPPVCLSMYYLAADGGKFDRMEFRDKQAPLLRSLYGDALERIELRTAPKRNRTDPKPQAQYGDTAPPVLAIVNLWVKSLDAYAAATLKAGDKIANGMKGVSSAKVAVQWEQLIGSKGDPRESVVAGTQCFSSLYPSTGDGTWDAKYVTETYLPMVMEAYGPDALRRVEVCKGISLQGGGKPLFLAALNMYIKDQPTFQSKAMTAGMTLMKEAPKYTTITPLMNNYDVFAVS